MGYISGSPASGFWLVCQGGSQTVDWKKEGEWNQCIYFPTVLPIEAPWSSFIPQLYSKSLLLSRRLLPDFLLFSFQPRGDNNPDFYTVCNIRNAELLWVLITEWGICYRNKILYNRGRGWVNKKKKGRVGPSEKAQTGSSEALVQVEKLELDRQSGKLVIVRCWTRMTKESWGRSLHLTVSQGLLLVSRVSNWEERTWGKAKLEPVYSSVSVLYHSKTVTIELY